MHQGGGSSCITVCDPDLCMWFDAKLSMRSRISRVAHTCFYYLHRIRAVRQQLGRDVTARLVPALVLSRPDYCNTVLAGLPAFTLAPFQWVLHGSQAAWPCDSSSSRVALVASRWEDPVQAVFAGSQVASGTHAGIYLRPFDIGCQYSRSIYTAWFIVLQLRRATDTSMNWRQSLFCCCPASIEQATDGAETAVMDRLVSSWSENISVLFCLRALRR